MNTCSGHIDTHTEKEDTSHEKWSTGILFSQLRSAMSPNRSKTPRNGRQHRRYLVRRLAILRAAGREFRSRGFVETGMRDIARAAELSPANLYNYFQGQHEILFFFPGKKLWWVKCDKRTHG